MIAAGDFQPLILYNFGTFTAVIYAISGGAAFCLLLMLALVIVLMRKVKSQRKTIELTSEEISEFMRGIATEKANAKGINGLFVLPYDTGLEIPKTDVTIRERYKLLAT